jgi:DNA-binding MarR family transcriptional regulator
MRVLVHKKQKLFSKDIHDLIPEITVYTCLMKLNISPLGAMVLSIILNEEGGLTASSTELARLFCVTRRGIQHCIKALKDRGYVIREGGISDKCLLPNMDKIIADCKANGLLSIAKNLNQIHTDFIDRRTKQIDG